MIGDKQLVNKFVRLITNGNSLSKQQWILILFISIAIFLSLGLGDHRIVVYKATIEPAENSIGPVKLVFYGNLYQDYLSSGALRTPEQGWRVDTFGDATTLTAVEPTPPLVFYSEGDPVRVGLLHFPNSGDVRLVDSSNVAKVIPLRSNSESVSVLTIGGYASDVPQSVDTKHASFFMLTGVFILIPVLLISIAQMQLRKCGVNPDEVITVDWSEIACFALPLFVSTTIYLLAFWPGNVSYDGSLQWYQAITRGNMEVPLGVTTTLFLRLFSHLSIYPAWVILFQSSLSAIGVALILKELRYRGVSRWAAQICTILLAILPQYPTFFTNLGKDALSAMGIIFFAWSLLSVARSIRDNRLNYFTLVILIAAAVFSGMIRVNVIPSAVFILIVTSAFLFFHGYRTAALATGVIFFAAAIFIPKIAFSLSDEQSAKDAGKNPQMTSKDDGFPLGWGANLYIYHLFSAAVHGGIPLSASDEEFFYRIAPRHAWANYDCYMADTTFIGVSKEVLLTPDEYRVFLKEHQPDLAMAVLRIIRDNPSILIDRQMCISKMLWYVGFGQKPFQATTTLGYENVDRGFMSIVGENKTLFPAITIREAIQNYLWWTETQHNFWFFWKPALIFYLGLFCVLFRLTVQRDSGLLFVLFLSLALTFVMFLLIPFPAYRYQYPTTLLMSLLCTLPFISTKNQLVRF